MSDSLIDLDMNDLAALRRAAPRKTSGRTVQSRARAEKRPSPADGRRNRITSSEPQVPLNVDVPPAVKQLVIQARANFGIPMKTFVRDAIQHYYHVLEVQQESEP